MKKHHGFTLIEVLVVLILIGIIASFVTLSIETRHPTKQLYQETQRLAALLTLAQQEAIMATKEVGLHIDEQGYQFYELVGETWQLIKQDDVFRPYHFTLPIKIDLQVEGSTVSFTSQIPQIMLFSSGEIIPFHLILNTEPPQNIMYKLVGELSGQFNIDSESLP